MDFGLIHPTMKVRITVVSYLDYELCFLATQLPSCLGSVDLVGFLCSFTLPSPFLVLAFTFAAVATWGVAYTDFSVIAFFSPPILC